MSDKNTKESGFSGILAAAAIGLLVALVVVLSFALFYLEFTGLSIADGENPSGYLGTLGDFIGGVLNPIAAVLSVGLLAYTLHQNSMALKMSRTELQLTRQELQRQADSLKDSATIQKETLAAESYRARSKMLWERFERIKQYPVIFNPDRAGIYGPDHGGAPRKDSILNLLTAQAGGVSVFVGRITGVNPSAQIQNGVSYPEVHWILETIIKEASIFHTLLLENSLLDEVEIDAELFSADLDRIHDVFSGGLYQVYFANQVTHQNKNISNNLIFNFCSNWQVSVIEDVKTQLDLLCEVINDIRNAPKTGSNYQ